MDFKVLFFILAVSYSVQAQSYTAAVLEYAPVVDASLTEEGNVLRNVERYREFIAQAVTRTANIIIFPEYGLTTINLPNNLTSVSTIVPVISARIAPCDNSTAYARFFSELSCAAREHSIHVVVNVVERNNTNATIFYNTNVVFDTTGIVIASYRKINLFNEPLFTAGTEAVTFTALDVTFGLMTCFDILFKNPSQEVLSRGATDIIYPTAWTSETPILQALSIQDGFAKSTGVNLLVSGYNNVANGVAGAGIYLANATIAEISLDSAGVQNIFSATIPRITARTPDAVCNNNINIAPRIGGTVPEVSQSLNVLQEDMSNYTFQSLPINVESITGEICSEGSTFCCKYTIDLNANLTSTSTIYRMAAFYGRRGFQNAVTRINTVGVHVCTLVACTNNDTSTCGRFNGTTNVNFKAIVISTTVATNNSYYQPATLGYDHRPLTTYAFCRANDSTVQNITLSITSQQSLFAFGIFGRLYEIDGQEHGRASANSYHLSSSLILSIISIYFCLKHLY